MKFSEKQVERELADILQDVGPHWSLAEQELFVANIEKAMLFPAYAKALNYNTKLSPLYTESRQAFIQCIQMVCMTFPEQERQEHLRLLFHFTECRPTIAFNTFSDESHFSSDDIDPKQLYAEINVNFSPQDISDFDHFIRSSADCIQKADKCVPGSGDQSQADLLANAGVFLSLALELVGRKSHTGTQDVNTNRLLDSLQYELNIETDEDLQYQTVAHIELHQKEIHEWYTHLIGKIPEHMPLHRKILPARKLSAPKRSELEIDGRENTEDFAEILQSYLTHNQFPTLVHLKI